MSSMIEATNKVCTALEFCQRDFANCERQYNAALQEAADANHMDTSLNDDGSLGAIGLQGNGSNFEEVSESNRKVRALQMYADCLNTSRLRLIVAQREFATLWRGGQ
jgi:hypothetical protein